jgi:hypothetical protein
MVAAVALAVFASVASADRYTELVSVGQGGQATPSGGGFAAASADGSLVIFPTTGSLVSSDHDLCPDPDGEEPPSPCSDLYARDLEKHTTELVSTGPQDASGPFQANFDGASEDARRVAFTTDEALVEADSDNGPDVYVRDISAGTTELVSTSASAPGGAPSGFDGISADGSRIAFSTLVQLVPEDTDTGLDVYVRDLDAGTTQLASTGPLDHGSTYPFADMQYGGFSADGSQVFFQTHDQLVSDDTDGIFDLYARDLDGHTTELVSKGPSAPGGGGGGFLASSPHGSRVLVLTQAALVPEDDDTCNAFPHSGCEDIYERDLALGTTTLVSVGPHSASGFFPASFFEAQGGASEDLDRVVFQTAEPLVAEDTNNFADLYERDLRTGTTRLVSKGPSAPGGGGGSFGAISRNGEKVFFDGGALVPEDRDAFGDVYEYDLGTDETTLVSTGPQTGNTQGYSSILTRFGFGSNGQLKSSHHGGISGDAAHVFFESQEQLVPADTNNDPDLYERDLTTNTTSLLSIGSTGISGTSPFGFGASTFDGSRVFFVSPNRLVPADTNNAPDVYASVLAQPPSHQCRPKEHGRTPKKCDQA